MANIGMGTGNVPESARAIASTKKDLIVCQACLCNTLYIDQNHGLPCCAEHGQLCCFARDHICIGEDTSKFATCSLLGLTCYPKFSCCQPLSHYYDAATHPAVKEKADYYPIFGYCMAGLCFQQPPVFQTIYLKTPTTCLSNDGICCCILHGDCAIPCDEGVPVACTLFYTGLLLYPKVRAARVVFEGRPWPARFNSGVATRKVRGRVAAPPRTSRGDAAAATWIFRGDESQRRRRSDVNSPNAGRVLHQGRRRVHRQRAACANPAPGRYASLPRRRRESPALRAVARRDPRPRLAAPRSSTARRASATSSRNMYSRSSPSRRSRAARRRTWREETHARRRRSGADESSAHEDARRDPRT